MLYFFYITNDRETPADEIVFSANDRCDQENLIAQLKGGVHALTTPVDTLERGGVALAPMIMRLFGAFSPLYVAESAPREGSSIGGTRSAPATTPRSNG